MVDAASTPFLRNFDPCLATVELPTSTHIENDGSTPSYGWRCRPCNCSFSYASEHLLRVRLAKPMTAEGSNAKIWWGLSTPGCAPPPCRFAGLLPALVRCLLVMESNAWHSVTQRHQGILYIHLWNDVACIHDWKEMLERWQLESVSQHAYGDESYTGRTFEGFFR